MILVITTMVLGFWCSSRCYVDLVAAACALVLLLLLLCGCPLKRRALRVVELHFF